VAKESPSNAGGLQRLLQAGLKSVQGYMPAHHRMYAQQFTREKPWTEKDYRPEELTKMRILIQQAEKEKYQPGRSPGIVDYDTSGGTSSQMQNIMHSLGEFRYKTDPKTGDTIITDTYDWGPEYTDQGYSGRASGTDVDTAMMGRFLRNQLDRSLRAGGKIGSQRLGGGKSFKQRMQPNLSMGQFFEEDIARRKDAFHDFLEMLGNWKGPRETSGTGIPVNIRLKKADPVF